MKTKALLFLVLVLPAFLLAVPEIPIRTESGVSDDKLKEIHLSIESLLDGISVFEALEEYGWFTELKHEGSAIRHPYLRYKEARMRIEEEYIKMSKRDFALHLMIFRNRALAADRRGLLERDRIAELIKKEPNKAMQTTPGTVTPRAEARVAPAPSVSDL